MTASHAEATDAQEQRLSTPAAATDFDLVRRTLAEHHPEADPAEVFTRALELSRYDADNARFQGGYARSVTGTLLTQLGAVFGLAGPSVVFLLQPIPGIPPWSRGALGVFLLIGAATYLYTSWTNRPRIPRTPTADASDWLAVVTIPRTERTTERLVEHYVLRALNPISSYAAEAGDHGDIAYPRHRRNQYSSLGTTLLVLTGVLSVVLLLLRL